jgi:adenylyltransferase/sulfurtransferase
MQSNDSDDLFKNVDVFEAAELIKQNSPNLRIVDVREPHEFEICRIDRAINCPLSDFLSALEKKQISSSQELLLYCHHGVRSAKAAAYLSTEGFSTVYTMDGGIDAWSNQIDSSIAKY